MKLLTADLHLTDNSADEYRWNVFEHIMQAIIQYKIDEVFILGDIVDRKDRHSSKLVNRLVEQLIMVASRVNWLYILRGNHDTPLHPPAFWEFLGECHENIQYITKPEINTLSRTALLPFSPNPIEDWKDLDFKKVNVAFLHATITGATENGIRFTNNNFPDLPRNISIYSGDIHTPQVVGNLTYVGAPHPVKFGDDYPCRMLVLNDKYEIEVEIKLTTMQKRIIEINSVKDLEKLDVRHGDQVRVKFNLDAKDVNNWGNFQTSISEWATNKHVMVVSTDAIIQNKSDKSSLPIDLSPEVILKEFSVQEKISDDMLKIGLDLLKEVL